MKNVQIFDDHATLSEQAAELIFQLIKNKPDAVICLASGDSPKQTYQLLTKKLQEAAVSLEALTIIGLDEWVGITADNTGSCAWFLHTYFIEPLGLKAEQFRIFDGLTKEQDAECQAMDDFISSHGGLDLMVVGIGLNGHIGFNEPEVNPDLYSHVIELDPITKSVGQKYFTEETQLSHGFTLGLKHIKESTQVLLLASGLKKAPIIKSTLEDPISTSIPSTLLRNHKNGLVFIDKEAASLLSFLNHK
jgi:glucosamine-6-phosphate isomerase